MSLDSRKTVSSKVKSGLFLIPGKHQCLEKPYLGSLSSKERPLQNSSVSQIQKSIPTNLKGNHVNIFATVPCYKKGTYN